MNWKIKSISILIISQYTCREICALLKVESCYSSRRHMCIELFIQTHSVKLIISPFLVIFYSKLYTQKTLLHCISHISRGFVSNGVLSPPLAFPFSFSCLQFRWHIGHVSLISIHFIIHLKNCNKCVCSKFTFVLSVVSMWKCWFWFIITHWHHLNTDWQLDHIDFVSSVLNNETTWVVCIGGSWEGNNFYYLHSKDFKHSPP